MKSLTLRATGLLKSPRARQWLQIGVAALVIFFFALALWNQLPKILTYNWQFDPLYLGLASVMLFVRGPIAAYGWQSIVRKLGHKLPWWRSVKIVFYSTMAGFVPGGMWHIVSRVYLAEKDGLPRIITAVSVIIESALVALAAAILAPLSMTAMPDFPIWIVLGALAVLGLFVVRPNDFFRLLNWLLVKTGRQPVDVSLSPWDMLRLLWPFLLNWTLFGVMSFWLVAALYPQLPIEYLPSLAGVFVAAWLVGYAAVFVPQGLIVREVIIFGFLVGIVGLPEPVASMSAILSRLWSMLGVGVWAAIASRL